MNELWAIALVLLVPTLVLLGMFIAYPFRYAAPTVVTNPRVGCGPGATFVGLANFYNRSFK